MTRKKLIEVALPLEAINAASAREKSIRHGHPSTLHLWWARRPLAAARAVIFASLVDDPNDPNALPAFVQACRNLPTPPRFAPDETPTPRDRLFWFIERLVTWEATTDEAILTTARELIMIATEGNPPPLLDPFAGGGSIPLEAQRLGLEAHASDLNPVAVMINKAQIEIPPRFANMPPVNARDNPRPLTLNPSPTASGGKGLEDSPSPREAWERGPGGEGQPGGEGPERWHITPAMRERMTEVARNLRRNATRSEDILWQALRNRQLENRKFKRQVDVGAFVLDFYCAEERLAVEVDGSIHALQQEADQQRQTLLESLGIRFVRLSADLVENNLPLALKQIRSAFNARQQSALPLSSRSVGEGAGGEGHLWHAAAGLAADVRYYGEWMRDRAWERIGHLYPPLTLNPSPTASRGEGLQKRGDSPLPSVGEGSGVRGETVIAWLWARTVTSPNPAVNAPVPLVRSFVLSKKKGRERWARPVIEGDTVRFEVTEGLPPKDQDGTVVRTGARCIVSGTPIPLDYIRAEGKAGRMGAMLMAIVTEGKRGRNYYSPTPEQAEIASRAVPDWKPTGDIPEQALGFRVQLYGMDEYNKLFTPRQLVALTTFSDLVAEAREQAHRDAITAGLPDDGVPLREGGRGARAYAEAVSVYLAFGVDRQVERTSTVASWQSSADKVRGTFARQALPMVWDYAEVNPFSGSTGNFLDNIEWVAEATESIFWKRIISTSYNSANQRDAANHQQDDTLVLSTDPPYYDNIGYADLSDFFYVWMRRSLREVYPDIFGTMLVPKEPELIASPYRHGGKEAANAHFERGMLHTFSNIRRFVSHDYPLTVYYAFKQQDGEEEEALTPDPSPTQGRGEKESRALTGGREGISPSPREERAVGEGFRVRGADTAGEAFSVRGADTGEEAFSVRGADTAGEAFSVRGADAQHDLSSPLPSVGEGPGVRGDEPGVRGDDPGVRGDDPGMGAARASTGWETFLAGLIQAGFSIGGTWPMRTERAVRTIGLGTNALASSIVLVCRPRPADAPTISRRQFVDLLRRELPAALTNLQSGSIAPVDLAQASIGPGMAIYSRYSKVLEADGSAMSVRAALGLINQELDAYLAEQDGDIDADTRFAVAWFEQYGFSEGEFGVADTLARAKNTSVAGVVEAGLVTAGRGKVRLLHWKDYLVERAYDPAADKRPTVWEATHHLIQELNIHGETGSAMLMTRLPSDTAAEARALAYRLYSICERKGWAEHARDYNALVASWSGIGEEAARIREEKARGDATNQLDLF